ncbi:unnamed protein product, partial [Gulo gulo]
SLTSAGPAGTRTARAARGTPRPRPPARGAAPAATRPSASGAGTRPASWSRGASPGPACRVACGQPGGRVDPLPTGCRGDAHCPKASHPLLPAQPLVLLQLPEQRLLKPEPQPQPQPRPQPRKLQQPQPWDPQPHAQPLPDPQSQLPQPEQLREWGLLSPDRPSLVPPGIGKGKGSGPRTCEGTCTPLLQRGPQAREDLEGGRPAEEEELGSAASRGPSPPPPACPPCPGNKEPLRTQGSPCPPSCLMPARQAGDSSVDPGTPRKVPDLGASPTLSTVPSDPLYQWADKAVGRQAGSKLDRRKNGLTFGASPPRLGCCFLLDR